MNPFADLRFFLCVRRVIRAVAPTLVHNVTVKPVLYGTLAARLAGVQGIVNAISGLGYAFSDKSRWVLAAVLRQAYRFALHGARVHVIFQNDDDAREFAAAGLVRASQITKIRGSGVDLRHFWPADEDSTEPPLVLLPARMLRDKGITEFVRAAQLLCRDGCSARFVLAGRLDHNNPAAFTRSELEQLLRDAPVEWLGHVEDMPALLRRAHIVCLPSYREGLPKSLIEACAVGRPIVTTDVPGCRAVVADGLNGLLVPPRDAEALAAALRRLIPDKELRAFLGRAARQRAEREFSVDSVVAQTLALYALAVQPG